MKPDWHQKIDFIEECFNKNIIPGEPAHMVAASDVFWLIQQVKDIPVLHQQLLMKKGKKKR